MEELLNAIEALLVQRRDYVQHQRFGERIVFESKNRQVHWIRVDTYNLENSGLPQDFNDSEPARNLF